MGVNKVVFGEDTLIDLTGVTATSDDVAKGKVIVDCSGNVVEGTMESFNPEALIQPFFTVRLHSTDTSIRWRQIGFNHKTGSRMCVYPSDSSNPQNVYTTDDFMISVGGTEKAIRIQKTCEKVMSTGGNASVNVYVDDELLTTAQCNLDPYATGGATGGQIRTWVGPFVNILTGEVYQDLAYVGEFNLNSTNGVTIIFDQRPRMAFFVQKTSTGSYKDASVIAHMYPSARSYATAFNKSNNSNVHLPSTFTFGYVTPSVKTNGLTYSFKSNSNAVYGLYDCYYLT